MHIQQLQLTQFRNYSDLSLTLNPTLNCIYGKNGSGKTNILDALHYLSFTRGFRSSQDKQAVQEGEDFFFTNAVLIKNSLSYQLQCNFIKRKGKKVILNGQPLQKMSEHIGSVPLVAVLPNDTDLITGPSALRRKFMDMLISQYDPQYLQQLIQYERILNQRNALLKLFAERRSFDPDELSIWDAQLIPAGIYIHKLRKEFLREFYPTFLNYFKLIVSDKETPQITYKSSIEENNREEWQNLLDEQRSKDMVLQYTTKGAHRDDLNFTINDQSVKNFGSQGQQKTFIIALKLGQYQLLQQHTQISPILLLDDIFDKLDEQRLKSIAQILDKEVGGQIFITDTSGDRLQTIFQDVAKDKVSFFEVIHGKVKVQP